MRLDSYFIRCPKTATTEQKRKTKPNIHIENFDPMDIWLIHKDVYATTHDNFIPVEEYELRRLTETCQAICQEPTLACTLLPIVRNGEPDNYGTQYFKNLHFIVKSLSELIETTNFDTESLYYTSNHSCAPKRTP